jgi:hypothetical protein
MYERKVNFMAMNGALWMTDHSGKMKGINSIGTSCVNNPYCIKRRENGESVCSHCYAATYMKMRKSLQDHLANNADILTTRLLKENEIPVTNANVFRFESFGDLYNTTHLANYVLIAERNPYTKFALWTKNTWILDDLFNKNGIKKPANLSIVVSSPLLNKPTELDRKKFWFVNHVFTVYDKKFIANNNVDINCGARSCVGCQLCYHTDTDFYVKEKLK